MDTKSYIISVNAVLKGDKIVVSGLQQIEGATKTFTKTVNMAGDKTQSFSDIIMKAGLRALIVAPMWLAIRSAMMLALSTVQGMIQANIDLEEGLARIRTVMFGTSTEIDAQMSGISRTILNTSMTTKISIKDLAEAFYFLKTSALTSEEALAGFQPLVNILTGTNVKAMEASRGLAGMYNTMGDSLGENLTVVEKMTKISDILTYTYAKQDVEMGELIAGYSKVAPYLVGLDDSFLDIVTTIGFLNTHMLRGARAGTLTAQSILALTKNSKELSSVFGITFDPSKPVNLLGTLEKMKQKLGESKKVTTEQGEALFKIFGIRGGVSPRLILGFFDDLIADLKDARDNADGYAKRIADIKMETITAQMGRFNNILGVTSNAFMEGALEGFTFVQIIKQLNNEMEALAKSGYLQIIGAQFKEVMANGMDFYRMLLNESMKVGVNIAQGKPINILGLDTGKKRAEENKKIAEENKKALEIDEAKEKSKTDSKINVQKVYEEGLKHTYDIMKANGADELDIQKAKVNEFTKADAQLQKIQKIEDEITNNLYLQKVAVKEFVPTLEQQNAVLQSQLLIESEIRTIRNKYGSLEDYKLAKLQEENKLLVEQIEYRKKITETLQTVGLDLLKQTGVQESVIITMKMRELALNRKAGDDINYLAQLEALRLSRIQAIVSEKLKEKQAQDNLILAYQKADENERARIRRLIELRQMSTTEIETQYENNAFDTSVIENNLDKFSEEVQQLIIKKFAEKFKLPFEDKTDIIEDASKELNPQLTENTNALRELTRIIQMLSQGSLINAQNTGIPLKLNQNTGQYNLPPVEEAYTAPIPLPAGSGYGRKVTGEYVNADKSRNSLNLLVELDVKGLKEEMNNVIGDRVKKLIDTDPILQKLLREQVLNKI